MFFCLFFSSTSTLESNCIYVQQTRCSRVCSINTFVTDSFIHSFIHWLSQSAFFFKCSKYHKSQAVRAWEPTFWENFPPAHHVTCHMLLVTCHMSSVKCNFFLLLFRQSGDAYWWRVCYQQGLSRLVYYHCTGANRLHVWHSSGFLNMNVFLSLLMALHKTWKYLGYQKMFPFCGYQLDSGLCWFFPSTLQRTCRCH